MAIDKQMDYSRMITALAMAKSEGWTLCNKLRAVRIDLQRHIEDIDQFLASNPTSQIDSWYDAMIKEDAEERAARRQST